MDATSSATPRDRLNPETVLQRAPNVRLLLTGANTVKVKLPGGTLDCGPMGLQLLERFSRPTSVRDAVGERVSGVQAWMDLLNTIAGLVDHGVLYDVDRGPPADEVRGYGFDNPRPHIEMLDDAVRTTRFIEAVERTVMPGDVVLDIGTGTGVLAMAAARAGAVRVYAIEAGTIAERAEQVIAANGFGDTITVLRGWSTSLSLPERADVLVTETIGSDPLDERILEIVTDARRRLLTPRPRVIPAGLSVFGTPLEVPEVALAPFVYTGARTDAWRETYGFDFEALLVPERHLHGYRVSMATARSWPRLAPPARLATVDLRTVESTSVDGGAVVESARHGQLDGALLHFTAELASGVRISSDPQEVEEIASWSNVLTLRPPARVQRGHALHLTYRWNVPSGPPGLSVALADDR